VGTYRRSANRSRHVPHWSTAQGHYRRIRGRTPRAHGHHQAQHFARANGALWLSIISSAPGKQGYVDGPAADALTTARGALPTAVLLDPSGTVGRLYHAKTTPHLFVIDKDGVLRYMGGIDSIASSDVADIAVAEPYLQEAVTAVVNGTAVANPVTRPYGCSVKY
jgi:hypothetical protein